MTQGAPPKKADPEYETDQPVLVDIREGVAWITMNRPRYRNAQNSQMTYALDAALRAAMDDDAVAVVVLTGSGKHFSAGHDIGSPGRDSHVAFERRSLWYDHTAREGAERQYVREQETYLGMCRRWRGSPKPMIAMVRGACIAGGLMLAWTCDLIVASDDAYFVDPVLRMGIPGVEYFAHPFELPPRVARELVLLGEPMSAQRAHTLGMVNRLTSVEALEYTTAAIAARITKIPRFALALTKQLFETTEDIQGKRSAMDAAFGIHHLAHAHNDLTAEDNLGGVNAKDMVGFNRRN